MTVGLGAAAIASGAMSHSGRLALISGCWAGFLWVWSAMFCQRRSGIARAGAPRAIECLGLGCLVGAATVGLTFGTSLALSEGAVAVETVPPALAFAALLGGIVGTLSIALLRQSQRVTRNLSFDGPDRLMVYGGWWLAAVALTSLIATAASLGALGPNSKLPWEGLVLPLCAMASGLSGVAWGLLRLRRRERWFERVLEGRDPTWDIRSADALELELDDLPPLFEGVSGPEAVLVRRADDQLVPLARVPWTVPSRASHPPSDPSAKGPPITTDIQRP